MISIVIPVFNTSKDAFKKCLESILANKYSDYEIVVIDDGSESNNSVYYREIISQNNKIRYQKTINQGAALARNKGVELSHGEYIMFVDADDYITNECLEQASKAIELYSPDIIYGLVKKKFDLSEKEFEDINSNMELLLDQNKTELACHIVGYKSDHFIYKSGGYIADGPVARCFRKSLFEEIKFDEKPYWNEDTIWNLRLLNDCENIVIVDNIWYIYLVNKNSFTQGYRNNCLQEFNYRVKQEYELAQNELSLYSQGIYYRIFNDIFLLGRTYLFHKKNKKSFKDKYIMFKNAIKSKEYLGTLRNVDFQCEKNVINKYIRKILKADMLYGKGLFAFMFCSFYCRTR